MIDHLSLANASDEEVQISLARNISIQNTILAETVGEHHIFGGMLINYSHSQRPQDNLSIHHNLWYRITERLPEISCELTRNIGDDDSAETPSFCSQQPLNIELSNNLLYDVNAALTYNDNTEGLGQPEAGIFTLNLNWVNNLMSVRPDFPFGMMSGTFITQPTNRLYFSGNHMNIYPDYADLQIVYCCNDFNLYNPSDETLAAQIQSARFDFPPITITPTEAVTDYMIANVGAFPRDAMDRRYLEAVAAGTFSDVSREYALEDDAFTLDFDPANPPAAPLDSDLDGMPDDWEVANNLDPQTQDNNGTQLSEQFTGVEGYTNLEVYLNMLADARLGENQ
ncbi:MAG: hypothetical protein H7Y09_05505 [Chitinophagaceae bacterium]|nr:hypothetical protein [Anaerolineae bacterium]